MKLADLKIPNKRVETYTDEQRMRLIEKPSATAMRITEPRSSIWPPPAARGSAPWEWTRLWPFSPTRHQPLFNYFKQLFAQVTNPPIDAIREKVVTSTTVYVGDDGNLLQEEPENCQVLKIENPILTNTDMLKIKNMKVKGL